MRLKKRTTSSTPPATERENARYPRSARVFPASQVTGDDPWAAAAADEFRPTALHADLVQHILHVRGCERFYDPQRQLESPVLTVQFSEGAPENHAGQYFTGLIEICKVSGTAPSRLNSVHEPETERRGASPDSKITELWLYHAA